MSTSTIDFDQLTLTPDQEAALNAFQAFMIDPVEQVFVLQGFSGCGKSTLIRVLLDRLPNFQRMVHLINPSAEPLEPQLTATTNKAAENLAQITGEDVGTIQSALGLRVDTDYKTGVSKLVVNHSTPFVEKKLLFIDEASFIDKDLLQHVFDRTKNCKVVFIGDPAQLAPVQSTGTPVFDAKFTGAALTQVVRQAEGNPIVDLSTKFRNTVKTGQFFSFKPDGHHIKWLDTQDFQDAIEQEFTRPDWRFADSKILAWTNKCVIGYNGFVRALAKGEPHFEAGDYAVNNSYIKTSSKSIKNDQTVQILAIGDEVEIHGVKGKMITLDMGLTLFQPNNLADKQAALKRLRQADNLAAVAKVEDTWLDLRAMYSCTINKAQGSTYGSVFIDLDDVRRCNSGDQIARMMYVAVSRAKNHVYLTGDLA